MPKAPRLEGSEGRRGGLLVTDRAHSLDHVNSAERLPGGFGAGSVDSSPGPEPGRGSLPDLLRAVATEGWNSRAGTEAVGVMQRACRQEASRWVRTAGWMTDEGLADTWEQMDRLMRRGRFDDAPGLLLKVVRRAYAGEAAAVQTGMGSSSTRGLVAAARLSEARSVTQFNEELATPVVTESDVQAPSWMRVLAAVLAREGWRWPVNPLHAVMAAAECVVQSGRRSRSPLAEPSDRSTCCDMVCAGSPDLRVGPGL